MALIFSESFDPFSASQLTAAFNTYSGSGITLSGPGRLGYGQYAVIGGTNFLANGLGASYTSLIVGAASYVDSALLPVLIANAQAAGGPLLFFDIAGNIIGQVSVGPLGQVYYITGNGTSVTYFSSNTGLVNPLTWFYLEAQVVFSNSSAGSITVRLNGTTVITQSSVTTNGLNSNACAGFGLGGYSGSLGFVDDVYCLNTTAPNNAFLGDVKVYPLYPAGNGRVSGFSRQGGTASGNWTAVSENPPDGDTSYVYTSTAGTADAYTLTALSNITTIKAVQIRAYTRKDDTPSRVLALGVGNGTTENYDSGQSVNTTYSYIRRPLDTNPLTSAAWSVSDFSTLQLAQKLIS